MNSLVQCKKPYATKFKDSSRLKELIVFLFSSLIVPKLITETGAEINLIIIL